MTDPHRIGNATGEAYQLDTGSWRWAAGRDAFGEWWETTGDAPTREEAERDMRREVQRLAGLGDGEGR